MVRKTKSAQSIYDIKLFVKLILSDRHFYALNIFQYLSPAFSLIAGHVNKPFDVHLLLNIF